MNAELSHDIHTFALPSELLQTIWGTISDNLPEGQPSDRCEGTEAEGIMIQVICRLSSAACLHQYQ